MSIGGVLLGLINIAIVVAILVLVGAIIVMFAKWAQFPIDWNVQRLYLLVVLLIALYMLVALLLGLPSVRIIGGDPEPFRVASRTAAAISAGAAFDLRGVLSAQR
jgi:hypothetical protein